MLVWIADDSPSQALAMSTHLQELAARNAELFGGTAFEQPRTFTRPGDVLEALSQAKKKGSGIPDVLLADVCMTGPTQGALVFFNALKVWDRSQPILIGTSNQGATAQPFRDAIEAHQCGSPWAHYVAKPRGLPRQDGAAQTDELTKPEIWRHYFLTAIRHWRGRERCAASTAVTTKVLSTALASPAWTKFCNDLDVASRLGADRYCAIQGSDATEREWLAQQLHQAWGSPGQPNFAPCGDEEPDGTIRRYAATIFGCESDSGMRKLDDTSGRGQIENIGKGTLVLDGFSDYQKVLASLREPLAQLLRDRKFSRIGSVDRVDFHGRVIVGVDRDGTWPPAGIADPALVLALPSFAALPPNDVVALAGALLRAAGCHRQLSGTVTSFLGQHLALLRWSSLTRWANAQASKPDTGLSIDESPELDTPSGTVSGNGRQSGQPQEFVLNRADQNLKLGCPPNEVSLDLKESEFAAVIMLLSFVPAADWPTKTTATVGLERCEERYEKIRDALGWKEIFARNGLSREVSGLRKKLKEHSNSVWRDFGRHIPKLMGVAAFQEADKLKIDWAKVRECSAGFAKSIEPRPT